MNATFKRPYGNHKTLGGSGDFKRRFRRGSQWRAPGGCEAARHCAIAGYHGQRTPPSGRPQFRRGGLHLAPVATSTVERAMQAYRDRRRREQVFGDASLFGEPAWDIMLDLFVAAAQEKRIAVTSACIGSAVPATTALRWIKILEDRGLIEREVDEGDARRTFVRLSPRGCELMEDYLTG
jgi:predicted transcriptional regulator